jgi:hypothetical protein
MSTNKLYVHVGAGKTGTSFIQEQCALQHEKLAEQGLWYPITTQLLKRIADGYVTSGNINALLPWLCPRHPVVQKRGLSMELEEARSWFKRLIKEADGRAVLLSSETLQHADSQAVAQLVEIASDSGYETIIIFYGRHALDHAISNYRQHLQLGMIAPVKDGKNGNTALEHWLKIRLVPFQQTLSLYSELLTDSAIRVRSYDDECENLLEQFLGHIDVSATPVTVNPTRQRINRSLTVSESELLIAITPLLKQEQVHLFGDWLISRPPTNSNQNHPRNFFVSSEALDRFSERHQAMIDDINRRWSHTLSSPLEVIPKSFKNGDRKPSDSEVLDVALHALSRSIQQSS